MLTCFCPPMSLWHHKPFCSVCIWYMHYYFNTLTEKTQLFSKTDAVFNNIPIRFFIAFSARKYNKKAATYFTHVAAFEFGFYLLQSFPRRSDSPASAAMVFFNLHAVTFYMNCITTLCFFSSSKKSCLFSMARKKEKLAMSPN